MLAEPLPFLPKSASTSCCLMPSFPISRKRRPGQADGGDGKDDRDDSRATDDHDDAWDGADEGHGDEGHHGSSW